MTGGAARHVPSLYLLKYFDASAAAEPGALVRLPYAVDSVRDQDVELRFTDAHHRPPWTRGPVRAVVRALERRTVPFLELVLAAPRLVRSDAVVAVFESQGHALAVLRRLHVWPFTRPRFGVVACWLAQDLEGFGRGRLAWYRWAYRGVDRLIYFSANQTAVYRDVLGLPEDRLVEVPFGIDADAFARRPDDREEGYVLAVGRDRGRDWATFFDAVRGTGVAVKVAARPAELAGHDLPDEVEMLGFVSPSEYRDLTAAAAVVVVPTHTLAYPTGQSVLLESMALERCCVVTDTPAIRSYVRDGETAVLVPPDRADLLREAVVAALGDPERRRRLGLAARSEVERLHDAPAMWARIVEALGLR